jgi:hypothetical protein
MLKSLEQGETKASHLKYWIFFQAIGVCLLKMKETPVSQCEKNFLLEVSKCPPRIRYPVPITIILIFETRKHLLGSTQLAYMH